MEVIRTLHANPSFGTLFPLVDFLVLILPNDVNSYLKAFQHTNEDIPVFWSVGQYMRASRTE